MRGGPLSGLRGRDRLALALLTPLWLACFGASLLSLGRPVVAVPLYTSPAPGPDASPTVHGFPPWVLATPQAEPAPRVGDRLLSVGGVGVAGAGRQRVAALAWAHTSPDGSLRLEVERDGRRIAADLRLPGTQSKWPLLPVSLGFATMATGGLLMAPRFRLCQLAYPAFMTIAFWMAGYFGRSPAELLAAFWVRMAAFAFLFPLSVRLIRFFPSGLDGARWARGWPALLALQGAWIANTELFGIAPGELTQQLTLAGMAAAAVLVLAIGTRQYLRSGPRARRRFRWLALGSWAAFLPTFAAIALHVVSSEPPEHWIASQLALLALPAAGAIAVFRDDLLDVDRVLASTVVLTVLGVAALVALGAGVPRGADWLVSRAGLEESTASLLLTLACFAGLAAAGLGLWRLVQRWVLQDQASLEDGVAALSAQLATCRKLRELTALLGDRLLELWKATGSAVYAGEAGQLVPVQARGSGVPVAPTLPATLEQRAGSGERPLALGTDAGLLLPLHRRGELAAVVVLGPKRSGDVYTPHDRALLAAVTGRASQVLEGIEHAALLEASRALHAELVREKEELGRASEAKSTLLVAAGHDLRQPLHAMGLFLGALEERISDPDARALLDRVRSSARSLGQMFDGLLDAARIDEGVLDPERRPVPLAPLFAQLEQEARPLAERRGLALRVRATGLAVESDPLLLRSILQNLMGNALRYTERGGVLLGARRRGGEVRIEVWDTGPGISEGERVRLFRAGQRGSDRRDVEGAGLGLALVEKLSARLGHRLALASRPGRGSLFAVSVPEASAAARGAEEESPAARSAGARGCVAVLDDDPEALDALRTLLEWWGFAVLEARSTDALLERIGRAAHPPDALLADLRLGGGASGLDAIARAREILGEDLPALVMSADTSDGAREQVRARGLLLLRKPVEPARLRAALDHLVGPKGRV
jgi:signal transduction histidine kinase/CheY-like chemotaxis protein